MHLRIGVLAVLLVPAMTSRALAQGATLGFTAGPHLSAMLFDDPYAMDDLEARVAWRVELRLARSLNRVIEFEAGLGAARTGFVDIGAHIGSLTMDVVQVPVAVRLGLPTRVSPYIKAGVAAALTFRCRVTDSVVASESSCRDPLLGTDYSSLDLAGLGALGVMIPVARGEGLIEITGSLGLRNLKRQPYPPGAVRTVAIGLLVGYRLPLSRLFK